MYGVVLHAHPARAESHIWRNATGEVATQTPVGPKFMFEQLWKYKKLKHHNFIALHVWGNVILNSDEKLYFLLH